eukprot:TRINITY_DN29142_c0_g1_i1.p1 TRINITY_DN29142_c0_g1~~TRINITY_DN29142_c0_g1_i1.p1  ORF type:complete len:612 (+),score=137.86 TRINITY_DN29142_c0_g1_i1:67-1902(+)
MGSGSSRKASSAYKLQVDPASTASPSEPSPKLDPPSSPCKESVVSPTPTVAELKGRLKEIGWKLPPDVVEKSELLALVQEAEHQQAVKAEDAAQRRKDLSPTSPHPAADCPTTAESPSNRSVAELKRKLKQLGLKVPGDIIEKNELRDLVEEAERQASLSRTSAEGPKAPVKPSAPVRLGSRLRELGVEVPDSIVDETELRTVLKEAEQKQPTVEFETLQGSAAVKMTCTRGMQGIARIEVQGSPETPPDSPIHDVQFDRQHWQRGDNVGHGSFGSVFKALNQQTGGYIAVKEVYIDVTKKSDEKLKAALENEIDLMRSLRHPNIVAYYGCDWAEDHLHMYLEYMAGGSLSQVLNQFGPLEESLIADYARQLLSGLEYLHTQNPYVVHRDIKGANVLVGIDSTVKLADFGCSKRAKETTSLTIEGSIPWMAPEVLTHSRFGRAGDIWSFGCLMIEMATADAPWGQFDNIMAAVLKIGMSGELPPVPEMVSVPCKSFIRRCTQIDPGSRLSASELLNEDFLSVRSADLEEAAARSDSADKTLIEPEEELPEGWEKHWDDGYSAWYYWHSTSGRSLWEPPLSMLEEASSDLMEPGLPPGGGGGGEIDLNKTLA